MNYVVLNHKQNNFNMKFNIEIQDPQTGKIYPIQLEGNYAGKNHVKVNNKEDAICIVANEVFIEGVEPNPEFDLGTPTTWYKSEIINWDEL